MDIFEFRDKYLKMCEYYDDNGEANDWDRVCHHGDEVCPLYNVDCNLHTCDLNMICDVVCKWHKDRIQGGTILMGTGMGSDIR